MMKKRYLFFILSFFLGIILFFWIIKSVGWQPIRDVFNAISFWQVFLIFILSLLIPLLEGYRWKKVLKIQNKEISFKDALSLGVASFSINFLAPILIGSAEFLRGYFLKKKKNYSGIKITSSIIIDRIIGWTVDALFTIFGLILFFYNIQVASHSLLIKISCLFIFLVSFLLLFYFRALKKKSIVSAFFNIFNKKINNTSTRIEKSVFSFFNLPKDKILEPFFVSFLKNLIMCLRVWVLIFFLGKNINFLSTIFILTFTYLAILVPVPASLGFHEVLQIFIFNSLTMSSSLAIAFTMVIRGVDFLVTLLGLFFLFRIGGSFFKKYFLKKSKNNTIVRKNV